jgi:hypothetical protein
MFPLAIASLVHQTAASEPRLARKCGRQTRLVRTHPRILRPELTLTGLPRYTNDLGRR